MLKADSFKHYIDTFNENDEEIYVQNVSNEKAWEFLKAHIPLFECPDKYFERTYYFWWWTYRKHIKNTPIGLCPYSERTSTLWNQQVEQD